MRILHTADWHVGKKLGRIDRRAEFEAVLDEIVSVARDQKVDLVVVSGDLMDRALPGLDALAMTFNVLYRLADVAGNVVAIPGNHDSAELFGLFRPMVEGRGIHLCPRICRPNEGGIVQVPSKDGMETASVAVFPFLHEAMVVDFMAESEEWYKGYADKVRLISQALGSAIDPSTVGILSAHFFVEGAELGGGERKIHISPHYAATAQAIPPNVHYIALGHIHKPQPVPAASIPARYSGSILQLDFSERSHTKEVVIVEATVGRPARVTPIPLSSGRKLLRVEDDIESLQSRANEFGDAYLDVRVKTSGPQFGLSEEVRKFLPNAVYIQASYERSETEIETSPRGERALTDIYAEFHSSPRGHGVPAPEALIDAMRSLEVEVVRAST